MQYAWNMTKTNWKKLVSDNAARRTGKKVDGNNVYGQVKVGSLSADIIHTLDEGDWYAFSDVFALGKDTGYGNTESGTPYALLSGSPVVPVRCKTFESFKKRFERNFDN